MTWRVKGKAVSPDQRQYLMSLPLRKPAKKVAMRQLATKDNSQ